MTDSSLTEEALENAPEGIPENEYPTKAGFEARFSDRLNPILVRELQQAATAKGFVGILGLALFAIVLLSLFFATEGGSSRSGRGAFIACLRVLAPIAIALIPMQAYGSMRSEVMGGTADMLLMTRLRPFQIMRGKILSAMIQFLLYLSAFAPLIALTYLLRGVDVPTIAMSLIFGALFCAAAVSVGAFCGACAIFKPLRTFPFVVMLVGLGSATMGLLVGMDDLYRELGYLIRDNEFWLITSSIAATTLFSIFFLTLTSASILTHPHENRSSGFRIFALISILAGFGLVIANVPSSWVDEACHVFGICCVSFGCPFWLFAVTEERALSPRVRTLVPARGPLRLLSIPFLPGAGRGLLFTMLFFGLTTLCVYVGPWLVGGRHTHGDTLKAYPMALGYAGLYCLAIAVLRQRFPQTKRYNWIARISMPVFLAFFIIFPFLIDLLFGGHSRWSFTHILNPFYTTFEVTGYRQRLSAAPIVTFLFVACVVLFILVIPSITKGFKEVKQAQEERRARESRDT